MVTRACQNVTLYVLCLSCKLYIRSLIRWLIIPQQDGWSREKASWHIVAETACIVCSWASSECRAQSWHIDSWQIVQSIKEQTQGRTKHYRIWGPKQTHWRPGTDLRFPWYWGAGSHISGQSTHEGGKVVSLMHRPSLPSAQEIFLVLISVGGWVNPKATVRQEGFCQWQIPVTIGNRNHDLPTRSAVSEPTAPPRAPGSEQ